VQVSCGSGNSCGLRDNGYVECWGKNNVGQSSPPRYQRFKTISVGNFMHSCGITHENNILCWGLNDRDQLGSENGEKYNFDKTFLYCTIWLSIRRGILNLLIVLCTLDNTYIDVSAGQRTTCGITTNRTIECWGRRSPIPIDERNMTTFEQITLGPEHLCAVDNSSEVRCWYSGPDMGSHLVPLGLTIRWTFVISEVITKLKISCSFQK